MMPDFPFQFVSLVTGEQGILCRRCGLVSWNLYDVEETYCPRCHDGPHATRIMGGRQNRWLAEMGYATWRRVMALELPALDAPDTFEASDPVVQRAWLAAVAAIRRRVVHWRLSAEECLDAAPEETSPGEQKGDTP